MLPARCIRPALSLLCAAGMLGAVSHGQAAPALMPQPVSYQFSGGAQAVGGGVRVEWHGVRTAVLDGAVKRFSARLAILSAHGAGPRSGAGLVLHITCANPDPDWLGIHMREHYQLRTGREGAVLVADGPAGVLRGLSTLLQLVERHGTDAVLADAVVDDSPRFAWRGLLVDVSRHFMSVAALERQLDMMELTKLNVLHLHLSDGQGFRVESHLFPRLQQVAGAGQYYTRQQVKALVAYATQRGIRIVPEFDTPGHSYAMLRAYPQYAAQPVTTPMDPKRVVRAALDPSNPQTYVFLAQLYHEMAGLFPDAYFHVGGDEVRPDEWTTNPVISAFMKQHGYADAPALQAAFTLRVQAMLAHEGKVMMGWDELIQDPVPASIMIEPWRGSRYTAQATAAGHPVVVSAGYYLDLLLPAMDHYLVDPLDPQGNGLPPDQVARAHAAFLDAFALDPAARMTPAQDQRVLGAEAALWTEIVTEEMLDGRLWPRSAALAERFWSPASVRDAESLAARLPAVQAELEQLGNRATIDRQRMMDRLAPHGTEALATLLSVVCPVRNYALNHVFGPGRIAPTESPPLLDRPADIAAPDSFVADAFLRDVRAYLAGQRDMAASLRARLENWRDNDARLQQAARVDTGLHDTLPASALLAQLAQAGLDALAGTPVGWRKHARETLAVAQEQFAASRSMLAVRTMPQPAGDLLQAITPGVAALVGAVTPGG